jgi:hypothetical protein
MNYWIIEGHVDSLILYKLLQKNTLVEIGRQITSTNDPKIPR